MVWRQGAEGPGGHVYLLLRIRTNSGGFRGSKSLTPCDMIWRRRKRGRSQPKHEDLMLFRAVCLPLPVYISRLSSSHFTNTFLFLSLSCSEFERRAGEGLNLQSVRIALDAYQSYGFHYFLSPVALVSLEGSSTKGPVASIQ